MNAKQNKSKKKPIIVRCVSETSVRLLILLCGVSSCLLLKIVDCSVGVKWRARAEGTGTYYMWVWEMTRMAIWKRERRFDIVCHSSRGKQTIYTHSAYVRVASARLLERFPWLLRAVMRCMRGTLTWGPTQLQPIAVTIY